jgi:hypothetical protein
MVDEIKQPQSGISWQSWIFRMAFFLVVVVGLSYAFSYQNQPSNLTSASEDFVKCLNNSGAVMYGTSWCHYCQQQKTMLAPYFEYITFVDCDMNVELCRSKGVTGYPTWIIQNKSESGLQEISQLETLSGCKI